ncbi:MAG TPA: HAD-IIB family hydrolase [Dermatophilaceae bacterium]|nr:HAD-IIB family hydrolase [Dermatophilaceae bacterium]
MTGPAPRLPDGRPSLVATDLDGTLLRRDGSLSARTRAAIRAAEDAGIDVIFVTARPPRWLHALADAVGPHGVVLAGNGAFVVDMRTRSVLSYSGFRRAELLPLVSDLRSAFPDAGFAVERHTGMTMELAYREIHAEGADVAALVERLDEIDDDAPTGKLLVVRSGEPGEQFLEDVDEVVGVRGQVQFSGATFLAEVSPPGVSKATVLASWCESRSIEPRDVWAFGDMPNDLPMLRWAGASFAVANAHPLVRSATTHHCPSNEEDGVALVLEAVVARTSAPRGPRTGG